MATCKDCIYFDVCGSADNTEYPDVECLKADCIRFKNKADYAEVKHGEWVYKKLNDGYFHDRCGNEWMCIVCAARSRRR